MIILKHFKQWKLSSFLKNDVPNNYLLIITQTETTGSNKISNK